MPTSDSAIQINVADATAASKAETYGEVIVIGEDSDNLADFNVVYTYYSQSEVEQKFGATSPIAKATAKVFAQGVDHVKVVNALKDDGAGGSVADYSTVLNSLVSEQVDYDIIAPTIGASDANMPTLVSHAGSEKKVLIIPDIGDKATVEANIGALTANEYCFAIAHDDATLAPGELAGAAAGVLGVLRPWVPPEWHEVQGISAASYAPSDVDALEGSNINTIIAVAQRSVISGAKSLTGSFIDIPRTKIYLAKEIKNALVNLKFRLANMGRKIPYSPAGVDMIKATIERVCRAAQTLGALRADYVDGNGNLVKGFLVSVPSYDSIPDSDKSNRVLNNVSVTAYLSGSISKITLDLVITL